MKNEILFPKDEELIKFCKEGMQFKDSKINEYIKVYHSILIKYKMPDIFINEIVDHTMVSITIKIFLCFNLKRFNYYGIKLPIYGAKRIIKFFGLVDNKFNKIYVNELLKGKAKGKGFAARFHSIFLRTFIYLGKVHIREVTFDDILKLDSDDFMNNDIIRRRIIILLEKLLILYNKKGNNVNILKKLKRKNEKENIDIYGTDKEELISNYKEFLYKKFILMGYQSEHPGSCLKIFFRWLNLNYEYINVLAEIKRKHINEYIEFVDKNEKKFTKSTKDKRINLIFRFFEWAIIEEKIEPGIINIGERKKEFYCYDSQDPRMFKRREHFMMVVDKLEKYESQDQQEELCRSFSIVVSACGLRLSEARWLDPDCIIDRKNNIGILMLKTIEKTNIYYKKTSIYPWGMKYLDLLIERFKSRPKIEIYNKKLDKFVYTLFEYDGRIITESVLNNFLRNKIFNDLKFYDDNHNLINYDGKKFHAFRHQKFNDIYEVTGESLKAVQIDSGHLRIAMAKRYTKQNKTKKIAEIHKAIDEARITGRGAELLKGLLDKKMLPEEYIRIAKILNISAYYSIDYIKNNLKFLGFGFCRAKECKISNLCESCVYFLTDEKYLKDLKRRYSVNYIFTMSKVNNPIILNDIINKQLTNLKYQEKWLYELGLSNIEIKELRVGLFLGDKI